jgi:hypothetical protein
MVWLCFFVAILLLLEKRMSSPQADAVPPLSTNHQVVVLEAAANWRRWKENGEEESRRKSISQMSLAMRHSDHAAVRAFASTVSGGLDLYEHIQDLND